MALGPAMIDVDIRTLFFVATLTTVLMAGAMVVLWRTHPTEPGGRYWAIGGALAATGFLFIWLRGAVPPFFSIPLANTLLAGGYGLVLLGVGRFAGRTVSPWPIVAAVAGVFAACLYFADEAADVNARVVVISTVVGVMALWCARRLTMDIPPGMGLTQGMTAAVFALQGFPLLLRAVMTFLGPAAVGHVFAPNTIHAVVYVNTIISSIGLTFGATAMVTRRLYLHLDHVASHDPLTGLLNRHAVVQAAAREMARSARHAYPLSVLLLDIDHFKRVNDTYGHNAGDAVLRAFATAVLTALRRDDVLGRYGGEEFLALLPNSDRQAALAVAERTRAAISAMAVSYGGRTIAITTSIGVAEIAGHDASWDDAMRAVDTALYEAKRAGRDRVVG